MKALVWEAPREMVIREYPLPEPQPDEALIKIAYAGICGSELSGYLGHNALRVPPLIMGHEFSGEIVALGAEAHTLNPGLAEGLRVTANPLHSCGTCSYCTHGLNQLCGSRRLIGAHRPGANAEFVTVPADSIVGLPDGVSLRTGALAEPVAVGIRIGEMAGPIKGEDVLVIGAGPIGLLALQALYARGAGRVLIADRDPDRLAMGRALGGEAIDAREVDTAQVVRDATENLGVGVAIDAVGTAVTRRQCVTATRSTGLVILSGLHEETSAMPAADIIRRELVVRGSFAYTPANFAAALQALADGSMRLDPWIVEAPLADGGAWFDRLIDAPGDVSKVLLVP